MPLIPKNSKDVKGLREYLTGHRASTQQCSVAEAFSQPLKDLFKETVTKIDAWLGQLPKDDVPGDWSLEYQLDSLFAIMTQLSAAASLSALEVSKLQTGEQFATALTTEIQKRITAGDLFDKDGLKTQLAAHVKVQVDAGDLVDKTRLTQLCSESKLAGFGEGEQKVRTELAAQEAEGKVITARKALVQAASLPLPDSEIEKTVLGGTDEEFKGRMDLFNTRHESLKAENIQLNADVALANLWLSETAYKGFEKTVKSLPALKFAANPFAVPGGAPGGKTNATVLVV